MISYVSSWVRARTQQVVLKARIEDRRADMARMAAMARQRGVPGVAGAPLVRWKLKVLKKTPELRLLGLLTCKEIR